MEFRSLDGIDKVLTSPERICTGLEQVEKAVLGHADNYFLVENGD